MGQKLLLIAFSFFTYLTNAQVLVDAVIWEATTKSGGKIIGVVNDSFEAQETIEEVAFLKEGTKYEIVDASFQDTKINLPNKQTTLKEHFISDNDYLEYKYLSDINLISLQFVEEGDLQAAIAFYKSVSLTKDESVIAERLKMLHRNYSKYLYIDQEPAEIVAADE